MWSKYTLPLLSVLLFPLFVYGSGFVQPNVKVVIYSVSEKPLMPFLSVDQDIKLSIKGVKSIDLKGLDKVSASKKVIESLSGNDEVGSVVFINPDDLLKITVLGDIEKPGSYWMPGNKLVGEINWYNNLFDRDHFNASYTLIRSGSRMKLSQEKLKKNLLQAGDIVLVSLDKRSIKKSTPDITPVESQASVKKEMITPEVGLLVEDERDELEEVSKTSDGEKVKAVEDDSPMLYPGDILRIELPGEDAFNKDFLIKRDGTIKLPEVGNLAVTDKNLSEAEIGIKNKLSEVYIRLEKLRVSLKEQRLLVSVLGYVEKPGEVELKNNGNVQTAIQAAGGMLEGAQLDRIKLRRGEEVIEFNYKKYLDTGDLGIIPELKPLDEIFIPASPQLGNVFGQKGGAGNAEGVDPTQDRSSISVFGEVGKPTTFPFKKNMSAVDALLLAGGVTRYANVEQVRIISDGNPQLFDLKAYLDSGNEQMLPFLEEGTTIFVPKQVEAVKSGGRVVYVMGQVQKPGAFETGENVSFMDVFSNAGGPNRYADTQRIRILRVTGEIVDFNLQAYTEGKVSELPVILSGDAVFVPQKDTGLDRSWLKLKSENAIHLLGAVKKTGRYEYNENLTFMDLLSHAGGPNERADLTRIKIIEKGPDGEAVSREFNLETFLEQGGNWEVMPTLVGGSTIVFPELPESPADNKANWLKLTSDQSIYIMGSVLTPGRYAFNDQLDMLDILSAAGGPKVEADLSNVRVIHRNGAAPRVSKLNLVRYFETGDETLLPDVQVGDTIYIPSRNRSWVEKKQEQTVRVLGAVKTSGRYEFSSEMSILDLLAEAGGPSKTAYIEKIIIVNASCCKNQAYTFDLMDFMKDPDVSRLPVIRPGDTIFVPDVTNTQFAYFMDTVRDVLSLVSLFSLTKQLISGSAL